MKRVILLCCMTVFFLSKGNCQEAQETTLMANVLKKSLDFASENVQKSTQNNLGAMEIPLTIKIDAKNWVNNLEQIVGRVIQIHKIDSLNNATISIHRSIASNTDSLRKDIQIPLNYEKIERSYKKESATELGFLGIRLDIGSNQEYRYVQNEMLYLTIHDSKIDKSKISNQYICDYSPCNYRYVLTASINKVETSLFTKKGNSIKASDLAGYGVVKSIEGKVALSNESSDFTRHFVLFLTLGDVNSLVQD